MNNTAVVSGAMADLIEDIKPRPKKGDTVDGTVIGVDKSQIYVDVHPFGTGVIYGREFNIARDVLRNVRAGDEISAQIIDEENEDGYFELSLREAREALIWNEANEAMRTGKTYELAITDANKGGLIIEWHGIPGFLPASQLKPEHYPRVPDGDKDKIFLELKQLMGEKLSVAIITADPNERKVIFSEKSPETPEREEVIEKYKVGDEVEGPITGIVEFGVFVKIEEGLEGLAHISELDWGLVDNPKDLFKVGETTKAKIIEIKDGKVSLSIKALKENPWVDAQKKYEKGTQVEGVVIKFNKHGALVAIEEGIAGLVHISDFGSEEKLRESLSLGMTYPFKITLFDAENRKMALSYSGQRPE